MKTAPHRFCPKNFSSPHHLPLEGPEGVAVDP